MRLLELADVYRAMASGLLAEPHVIDRVADVSGDEPYHASRSVREIRSAELSLIQEGLRGVALPVFREIMLRIYKAKLVGPAPKFPRGIEEGIDKYLALLAKGEI